MGEDGCEVVGSVTKTMLFRPVKMAMMAPAQRKDYT